MYRPFLLVLVGDALTILPCVLSLHCICCFAICPVTLNPQITTTKFPSSKTSSFLLFSLLGGSRPTLDLGASFKHFFCCSDLCFFCCKGLCFILFFQRHSLFCCSGFCILLFVLEIFCFLFFYWRDSCFLVVAAAVVIPVLTWL
jgi:hypothetical protein